MILCEVVLHVVDWIVLGFTFPPDDRRASVLEFTFPLDDGRVSVLGSRGSRMSSAGGRGNAVAITEVPRASRVHVLSGIPFEPSCVVKANEVTVVAGTKVKAAGGAGPVVGAEALIDILERVKEITYIVLCTVKILKNTRLQRIERKKH